MGILIDKDKCCYCGACVAVCPVACIELKETRIMSHNDQCINCSMCVKMCPVGAISMDKALIESTSR